MRSSRRLYIMLATATACATAFAGAALASAGLVSPSVSRATPHVLLVCNTAHCPTAAFTTVQAAVNAARPGDWILISPGVYHETGGSAWHAGVYVPKSKRGLHIRGLNRNKVIIDGSNGTAASPCPSAPSSQNFTATGMDGLFIAASGVTVQNLTVCDYLGNNAHNGNEIWWNGGDGSGKIGMHGFRGSYLSATAEYNPGATAFNDPHFAQYGIFVSNASGGTITHSYASNMADAAYYVGACQRVCDTVLSRDVGTNSALGYSGTNAGGRLVIENSVFFKNRAGIVPNSLNNDDAPPPQDGRCPHTNRSCLIIQHNLIMNNNNPNVPLSIFPSPAIGAGVEISGGKYDTVRFNVIKNQGSWGVITHDVPDFEPPPPLSHCQGGRILTSGPLKGACLFPAKGNRTYGNVFLHVGFFGNHSNSDLATETLKANTPRNCFYANQARRDGHAVALTSSPAHIERPTVDGPPCGRKGTGNVAALFRALVCATNFLGTPCEHYPQPSSLRIIALPRLRSMPNPCAGVPANAFCKH